MKRLLVGLVWLAWLAFVLGMLYLPEKVNIGMVVGVAFLGLVAARLLTLIILTERRS